jgi:hypothetical protein
VAFKDLSIAEMVSLFSPWATDPKAKAEFVKVPDLAGIHSHVVRAYDGVLSARPPDATTSPELQALFAQEDEVDGRHDRLARAIAGGIEVQKNLANAATPPDTERAAACEAADAKLFPNGMGFINSSYRAESGNTARAAKVCVEDAELVAFLKSIPTKKGETLFAVTERWIAEGAMLGKLEDKKDKLLAKLAAAPAPKPAAVQQARNFFIRTATRILDVLADSTAPAADVDPIRNRLVDAAEKAGKRAAAARGPAAPPVVSTPAAPTGKTTA